MTLTCECCGESDCKTSKMIGRLEQERDRLAEKLNLVNHLCFESEKCVQELVKERDQARAEALKWKEENEKTMAWGRAITMPELKRAQVAEEEWKRRAEDLEKMLARFSDFKVGPCRCCDSEGWLNLVREARALLRGE